METSEWKLKAIKRVVANCRRKIARIEKKYPHDNSGYVIRYEATAFGMVEDILHSRKPSTTIRQAPK